MLTLVLDIVYCSFTADKTAKPCKQALCRLTFTVPAIPPPLLVPAPLTPAEVGRQSVCVRQAARTPHTNSKTHHQAQD